MKALLIIALYAVFAKSAFSLQKPSKEYIAFENVSKQCDDELKVSDADFDRFYKNGMSSATQGIKCHVKCVMEKLHHMKNGVFDVDAAMKTWNSIPEFKNNAPEIAKGYTTCKTKKGKDDCETAFLISMCIYDLDIGGSTKKA